jgi:hypothetical protein
VNSQCAGNLCLTDANADTCLAACRNSNDCGPGQGCWYFLPNQSNNAVSACWPTPPSASSPGQTCGVPTDCGNELCVQGMCTDVCYTDADCMSVTGLSHCIPHQLTVMAGGSVEAPICSP